MGERVYFPINEVMARQAKEMMSFDNYKEGSKTAEYKIYADKAYDLAQRIEQERPAEAERGWRIATTYARRMADNMNRMSRVGTMCPSILISGGGNFPVRKKEKQNAAMDNAMREYNDIQKYLERLKGILHGKAIIKANDEDAILRLEAKISEREALQDTMKEVNAYYRKNKTLDGCPELTQGQIEKLNADRESSWRKDDWRPFISYQLTNNNAEIRRLKSRLESLKEIKEADNEKTRYEELGLTVKMNTEAVRIQLLFDDKPDADVRDVVKKNGFRWSPKAGAWQRQITTNGNYALDRVIESLKNMQGAEE